MTRRSPSRKEGSPCFANISAIVIPAAASISVSASTKASPSRCARRRPVDVLPDPIKPTSTIERSPSACVSAAMRRSCTLSFISFTGSELMVMPDFSMGIRGI